MGKKHVEKEKDQRKRFIKKARELECDESEAAFDEKLRRALKAPPKKKRKQEKQKDKPG